MGILALGNMVLAMFVSVVTFQLAKAIWRMPMILNLPGAFCMFNAVISLSGWLLHDLFDGYMHMSAPDVPWYYWLAYLGIALFWYAAMAYSLAKWRDGSQEPQETSH